ncbi:MAG TPA: hypothetical protein PKY05_03580 [Fibrobacteria bacterium]|nr:hypothetical protein [Fibrobacteria bacterium]
MKRHELRDVCLEDFLKIKCFILVNGDRKTYCNKWSHNPHFAFPDFDVFLDPGPIEHDGPGRWNVADDPAGTDFNTLVIRTKENVFYDIRYDRNISGIQVRDNRGKEGDN